MFNTAPAVGWGKARLWHLLTPWCKYNTLASFKLLMRYPGGSRGLGRDAHSGSGPGGQLQTPLGFSRPSALLSSPPSPTPGAGQPPPVPCTPDTPPHTPAPCHPQAGVGPGDLTQVSQEAAASACPSQGPQASSVPRFSPLCQGRGGGIVMPPSQHRCEYLRHIRSLAQLLALNLQKNVTSLQSQ